MEPITERRSFLNRLKLGTAAAFALGGIARAQVKPATPFVPARHDKDDWLDKIPGKHRMVIDTTSSSAFADSLLFASNFLLVNRNEYGLQNSDIALVVIARHVSTSFGFNNAMWAKYSVPMADGFVDPKTKQTPKTNVFQAEASAGPASLDGLASQGVQFAVCSMATRRIAGTIAKATGGNTNSIFDELSANLIGNGRLAPAGILVVNRAQERGYSLVTA
jgi:intracellular sulfur oxidation DsrE/DsrF family protein